VRGRKGSISLTKISRKFRKNAPFNQTGDLGKYACSRLGWRLNFKLQVKAKRKRGVELRLINAVYVLR